MLALRVIVQFITISTVAIRIQFVICAVISDSLATRLCVHVAYWIKIWEQSQNYTPRIIEERLQSTRNNSLPIFILVRHFQVLYCQIRHFSGSAFSCSATWSVVFGSCIFSLLRHLY